MRHKSLLLALGLALTSFALLLPARADEGDGDQEPPAQHLKCKQGWAFDECNEGYSQCTTPGTSCVYCATPTTEKIDKCQTVQEESTCKVEVQVNDQLWTKCGDRMTGTCVPNQQGGHTCQAVVSGTCGAIADRCKP